jgi:hypothetical protein
MGTKLVRRQGLIGIAAAAALWAACKPSPAPPSPTNEPRIRATVVTIQTTLDPQKKTLTHTLVIAGDRARSSDDVDAWRLFDLKKKQVTFVDDVAKTYRDVPLADLLADRRKELAQPAPSIVPRAEHVVTGAKRTLLGVEASEHLIRLGGYERHVWIGRHGALPDDLFAMAEASLPRTSSLAGAAREVDEALMAVRGFPLLDHAELPYGNKKMVVDRSVVKIEQREVPASWLTIPAGFQNLSAQSLSRGAAAGSAETPQLK